MSPAAVRVGVLGAYGRMGVAICEALDRDPSTELVAAVGSSDPAQALVDAGVEVVVDVSTARASREILPWCAGEGIAVVTGVTGFTDADRMDLHTAFVRADKPCFVVPNFSIGAVLLMRFAEQAAPYFDAVEVIEMHHENKRDAPSGTAELTAERISGARGRAPWTPDATEAERDCSRGALIDGIRVHSIRLPGLVAHEAVLFGAPGQTLTLRHDSTHRSSFMPGVLISVQNVRELPPGLTIGLDSILERNRE